MRVLIWASIGRGSYRTHQRVEEACEERAEACKEHDTREYKQGAGEAHNAAEAEQQEDLAQHRVGVNIAVAASARESRSAPLTERQHTRLFSTLSIGPAWRALSTLLCCSAHNDDCAYAAAKLCVLTSMPFSASRLVEAGDAGVSTTQMVSRRNSVRLKP